MSTPESFFAVVVGINHYVGLSDLYYAVSDANQMNKFLVEKLGVPEQNIHVLLDDEATHDNIIDAIRSHLTNNRTIEHGDPMLFYYAGHGARYPAPENWPTDDGECEALCPADRRETGENESLEEERDRTDGADIADRTLGALFAELAQAKGDNITIIMDCCNSGSITRGSEEPELEGLRTRLAPPLSSKVRREAMFAEATRLLDNVSQQTTRGTDTVRGVRNTHGSSHVLLAACRQDQYAAEWSARRSGVFTESLMQALNKLDLAKLTYTMLRDALKFPKKLEGRQIPQCEGANRHRILFNGKAMGINPRLVPIGLSLDMKLRVEAGTIHGVVLGTEFTVHSSQFHFTGRELGSVRVTEVYAVWSYIEPIDLVLPVPSGCYALVTSWGNVNDPFKVGFRSPVKSLEDRLEELSVDANRSAVSKRWGADMHMVRTEVKDATLVVSSVTEKEIVLDRVDPLTREAGCASEITQELSVSHDEWEILKIASRFNYHLYRENTQHPFCQQVNISLVRLTPGPFRELTEENYIKNGRADLKFDEEARYAMVLHNLSNVDLWCYLYYFDPSDYSIAEMYAPPSPNMLPPLRRGSKIVFGHGSADVEPFEFMVKEGEKHDAGFMKVLLSTEYADLRMIEQEGGFSYVDPGEHRGGELPKSEGGWDSVLTIVDVQVE